MISTIDKHMGELIDWVDSLGIEENTLILFLSDNRGGNGQRIYYHDVRFGKEPSSLDKYPMNQLLTTI